MLITSQSDEVGRLCEALGFDSKRVTRISFDIRPQEAVGFIVEYYASGKDLEAVIDFVGLFEPHPLPQLKAWAERKVGE